MVPIGYQSSDGFLCPRAIGGYGAPVAWSIAFFFQFGCAGGTVLKAGVPIATLPRGVTGQVGSILVANYQGSAEIFGLADSGQVTSLATMTLSNNSGVYPGVSTVNVSDQPVAGKPCHPSHDRAETITFASAAADEVAVAIHASEMDNPASGCSRTDQKRSSLDRNEVRVRSKDAEWRSYGIQQYSRDGITGLYWAGGWKAVLDHGTTIVDLQETAPENKSAWCWVNQGPTDRKIRARCLNGLIRDRADRVQIVGGEIVRVRVMEGGPVTLTRWDARTLEADGAPLVLEAPGTVGNTSDARGSAHPTEVWKNNVLPLRLSNGDVAIVLSLAGGRWRYCIADREGWRLTKDLDLPARAWLRLTGAGSPVVRWSDGDWQFFQFLTSDGRFGPRFRVSDRVDFPGFEGCPRDLEMEGTAILPLVVASSRSETCKSRWAIFRMSPN